MVLHFTADATQADYGSMAATIKSHAKIAGVDLLVDGQMPAAADVPDGDDLYLQMSLNVIVQTPEAP